MPRTVFKLRRAGLICIGALCVIAGLVLVYALVRPGVLGRTSTAQLAMVAGLLIWPGLTYALMRVDNAMVSRRRPTDRSASEVSDGSSDGRPRSAA